MTFDDEVASSVRQHAPRASIPLGQIWTALTSEIGGIFTDNPDSTTDGSGASASPATVTMITTNVPVPVYTTTVDTTLVKTSFVTVRVTTQIPAPAPHTTQTGDSQSSKQSTTTTAPEHTTLPEIVTRSVTSPTTSGSGSHHTEQSATAPSSTSSPAVSSNNSDRKHAIIGGLSGAIAGLVLIGALIIFFLRRRRRRDDDGESRESMSEKGLRPILSRKWSELTTRKSVAVAQPAVSRGSTPDLDGGLLRVSMDNWARPYANGQSFRESMGPRRLQVMNPDTSRPETPLRRSSDSNVAGSFLRQPRTAFAAFLGNRSRGNSATRTPSRDANIPTIAIQTAGSSGHGTPQGATPSFRSYSSVTSLPVVEQRPPEDPFLTPPDERDELSAPSSPRRPGIAPLQSAAGAASRTLSHLGSALNPFRSKSNMTVKSQASRRSVSTFFSSSSEGDPFALDRPSIYERSLRGQGSEHDRSLRRAGSDAEPPEMPRWTVYEGT